MEQIVINGCNECGENKCQRVEQKYSHGTHFGEHITIDGYQCSQKFLNNQEKVLLCLNELPELLEMKPLSVPEIYYAKGGSPKDQGGWTGVVVIEESHISIHTFPNAQFISVDVYTCKNGMSVHLIENYFRDMFDIGFAELNYIRRGQFYSQYCG